MAVIGKNKIKTENIGRCFVLFSFSTTESIRFLSSTQPRPQGLLLVQMAIGETKATGILHESWTILLHDT